jgi:hydrogenase 3 maturation protease
LRESDDALKKELDTWLAKSERIVIAGIGNPIRTDDFVGVKIVNDLHGRVSERVTLIECETVPESYLQDIIDLKPSHVLLIDAAVLGLAPGETKLINPELITDFPAITTHVLPLRVFCEYISESIAARIGLLLIQPSSVEFGEGLTPEIEATAAKITSILIYYLGSKDTLTDVQAVDRLRAESKGGMGDKT